jgi:DNA-binding NarL/FixJ family response regulator
MTLKIVKGQLENICQRVTISVYLVHHHAVVVDGLRCLLQTDPDIKVVGQANNGRTAVQEIGQLMPDVAIIDVEMLDLNGSEAAQLIHDRYPAISIIMLFTTADPKFVFRAWRAGARGYLSKASSGREVIDAVRVVHAGKRYFTRQIAANVIDDYISEPPATHPLDSLSSRERQVLQLFVEGKSVALIAETVALSPRTVETYRRRLMQKLGINNLPALVKFAIKHGITSVE